MPSDEMSGIASASDGTTFRSLSKYSSGRLRAWITPISVLVDPLLGSSVAGSSAPRVTGRVWSSARSTAAAEADADAPALADAPLLAEALAEPLGVSELAAALAAVL